MEGKDRINWVICQCANVPMFQFGNAPRIQLEEAEILKETELEFERFGFQ
jgi:hypothetical protein